MQRKLKGIGIDNRYTYLSDYNLIINNEICNIFTKYWSSKKIKSSNISLKKDAIERNIKNLSQLTFEVSQDCNLACAYCPYNGGFFFERNKTNLDMSTEIAIKGIDYIHTLINDRYKKNLTLSFYGGEPLLKFKKIKNIVKYTKEKFCNWDLRFSITTNGTIINEEIIDFFILNKFSILISLDGPQHNHDAKRLYTDNKGTFSTIWGNIMKIIKTDPKYFKKKVSFSVAYSKDLSLIDTFDFFQNNKNIKQNNLRFNYVNAKNSNYYTRYPNTHFNLEKDLAQIRARIREKHKANNPITIPIEKEFSSANFVELSKREFSLLAGACTVPSRLFLDVKGIFHICEKINCHFSIGDVWNGFNYSKIKKIVKDYFSITRNHCLKCKIKFLCNPCYVNFAEGGKFELDKEFCKAKQISILNKLKDYILLNQVVPRNIQKPNLVKRKEFHQFIMLDYGPVNVAIIDILKGNIYQVEQEVLEKFKNGQYDEIAEFVEAASNEEILIEIDRDTWIPTRFDENKKHLFFEHLNGNVIGQLELEEGVDADIIKNKFSGFRISQLNYYGKNEIKPIINADIINYCERDFNRCLALSKVDGNFMKIQDVQYSKNKRYNSCWGSKIAVTKDGKVRPCIYSEIVIGDMYADDGVELLIEKLKKLWYLTKDKIDKCKDCELRYACFDCREIAFREKNNIYATNPYCKYNPYKGTWED